MKTVSIIGANSSIARNFYYYLKPLPNIKIYLYDRQEKLIDETEDEYHQIDFSDKNSMREICFHCDFLYIFTGKTGASKGFQEYESFLSINELILLRILDEVVNQNAKCRIIYPSSRLVYDGEQIMPLKENDRINPKSIYAINKIAAEQYLKLYHKVYGIDYTIFRIAIPFGVLNPRISEYGMVASLVNQAKNNKTITLFGKGESVRTFTHISDICHVLWEGSIAKETCNEIFNIGGHVYSLNELVKRIVKVYPAEIVSVDWPKLEKDVEVINGWLDSSKLDSILKIDYQDIYI